MTLEETVRNQQAFRKSVNEFLSIATMLTDQELEIALARIADRMNSTSDERFRIQSRFRGQLLKRYYDMRLAGTKRFASFKRWKAEWKRELSFSWKMLKSNEEFFLQQILEHHIKFPPNLHEFGQWADNFFTPEAKI